ncbi:MAG: hypothetical protein O3B87_03360 [bacterium]|nr:hypothetical protein [bacterium]
MNKTTIVTLLTVVFFGAGALLFSLGVQKYQVLTSSRADEITCNGTPVGQCVGAKRCANNPADDGKYYYWCIKCGADGNPEQNEQGTGECCGNCGGPAPTGEQGACTDTTITTDEALCTAKCSGRYNSEDPNDCSANGGVSCGAGCAYYDSNHLQCGTCQGTNTAGWDELCWKGAEGSSNTITIHTGTAEDNSCPISSNPRVITLNSGQCHSLGNCEQADPNGGVGQCNASGCGGTPDPTSPPGSTATPTVPPNSTPTNTPIPPTATPSPLPCATDFNVTCSTDGTKVTMKWTGVTGAEKYVVRLNHEPYDPPTNWFNAAQGDQWLFDTTIERVINITPGVNYEYDVQPVKPSEPTPYQGQRCPFARFICAAPTATPTATHTPTHTPTRTLTPVPPTATHTAVPPTATHTAVPPTATHTLVPATATPTQVVVVVTNTPIPVVIVSAPTPTPVTQLAVAEQKPGITPWAVLLIPVIMVLLGLAL